ncbi:MAG: phosphotransferase enzyme family protein [Streptosporangiaceae bacterium]
MHSQPPAPLLPDAELAVLAKPPRSREGRAWLVDWQHEQGLLRQTVLAADVDAVERTTDDVTWLHGLLTGLAPTGFPAPRPLPAFAGRSWTIGAGSLWQLVTYLPGQVVGWSAAPSMAQIGALMGRYHVAVSTLERAAQRPGALPLIDVPAILLSGQLAAAGVRGDRAARIRDLAAQLAGDLADAGLASTGRLTIHGDFPCHNVLATGTPPVPAGGIAFELAHVDSPLADIGYGLWRSGRPHQHAVDLDASRVQQFLHGYAGARALTADAARLIPGYRRGRSLQMIARRVRAGRPETGMLARVGWLSAHRDELAEIFAATR